MITVASLRKNFQTVSVKESARNIYNKAAESAGQLRSVKFSMPDMIEGLNRAKGDVSKLWVGAVIVVATVLPQLALLLNPILGSYVTALALVGVLSVALANNKVRKLAISAAILPLATMVSLSISATSSMLTRISVEYAVILVLSVTYRYLFKIKPVKKQRVGLKKYPQVLPLMIIIGEVLGAAAFGMLRHQYIFKGSSLPLVAVAVITFAATEELFFRGLIQYFATKLMRPAYAAVLTAIVYTGTAIGLGSVLPVGFMLIAAAAISAIYFYKQNLVLTTFANVAMKLTYLGLIVTFILK